MIEDEEIPIEIDKGFKNKTVPTAKEIKAENKKEKQEHLDLAGAYCDEDLTSCKRKGQKPNSKSTFSSKRRKTKRFKN